MRCIFLPCVESKLIVISLAELGIGQPTFQRYFQQNFSYAIPGSTRLIRTVTKPVNHYSSFVFAFNSLVLIIFPLMMLVFDYCEMELN